jgi:WXG100 family type VII secretion target
MFNGGNMPASKVRSDRDGLKEVEGKFNNEAQRVEQFSRDIMSKMDKLKGGDWVGEAATKFYERMESEVIPECNRLRDAMYESAKVTKQISQIMQELEDHTSRIFVIRLG